ncbi:hypothetical protein D6833_06175, partial [Candidatus Parcubacteria bacterium]
MRTFHICFLIGVVAAIVCQRTGLAVESSIRLIPSWHAVLDELKRAPTNDQGPLNQVWRRSAWLQQLVRERNTNALIELGYQIKEAALPVYFALREFDRRSAQEVGMHYVLETAFERNALAITLVAAQITEDLPNPWFKQALSTSLARRPASEFNVDVMVSNVPFDVLLDWFEDADRQRVLPTCEAIVWKTLYRGLRKRGRRPTARMVERLGGYAAIPGVPRRVFACYCRSDHPLL